MPLSDRQKLFVAEYLIDRNGTQAYIRAGYSEKGAAQGAERLLRNVEVAKAIGAAVQRVCKRAEVSVVQVLEDLDEIREMAVRDGEYGPAVRAVELRGRHISMWPNVGRLEHTGPNGGPIQAITGTVVVDVASLGIKQREQFKAMLLKAKAKEVETTE